jgi:hypothetical protein
MADRFIVFRTGRVVCRGVVFSWGYRPLSYQGCIRRLNLKLRQASLSLFRDGVISTSGVICDINHC